VIHAIAALALASAASAAAAASQPQTLVSNAPWWEKVTVTVAGDGNPQACRFESSLKAGSDDCEVVGTAAGASEGSGSKGEYTRITFERRFSPGRVPDAGNLQPGDTLLGRQVMALAIDGSGAVKGCEIVAQSGDMAPEYGCKEAAAERFQASATTDGKAAPRAAYMTIIVYGHAEHIV
jgi:hypothetical protein